MNRALLIGGLAALAFGILGAVPARADDDCDVYGRRRGYDSRYYGDRYSGGNYGDRWHRDFRYGSRGDYGDYGSGYGSYGRKDREHDRHHDTLEREHSRAHRRGFDSRRDHGRWHHNAGEHHDADHHRIEDRHAPNRKRYYGDERDYSRGRRW